MPYFKMVRMGFTCILKTNTFLVGRYWDFKTVLSVILGLRAPMLALMSCSLTGFRSVFLPNYQLLSHQTIVEETTVITMREFNLVEKNIINP